MKSVAAALLVGGFFIGCSKSNGNGTNDGSTETPNDPAVTEQSRKMGLEGTWQAEIANVAGLLCQPVLRVFENKIANINVCAPREDFENFKQGTVYVHVSRIGSFEFASENSIKPKTNLMCESKNHNDNPISIALSENTLLWGGKVALAKNPESNDEDETTLTPVLVGCIVEKNGALFFEEDKSMTLFLQNELE